MALQKQVRGIGPKSGIFWAGRPTTMLVLDDAFVFVQVSTLAGILGAQGAIGPLVHAAKQHRDAKALDAAGDELTAERFAGEKRTRVIPFADVGTARIEGAKRARKLTIEAPDGPTHLKYAAKVWPDDEAGAFLASRLEERFAGHG